ncbi:MAG: MATE family efflux transporter [Treponema sp.]|nr:MATE family efflux transporter [Treponema sp.]
MEKIDSEKNILGQERVGKLLVKFAVPGIISMVVNAFYNIIDQYFISHGVNYLGNGATSVIFPMATLAMAFAMLFGDGAASFMSLKMGQGDYRKANMGAAAGIIGFIGSGIVIAAVYIIFIEQLCRIFGASDGILPYAKDYGLIISFGIPFSSICAGGASIIRADGSPRFNMIGLLTGCAINLILDPIFIFVCHWGVKGAGWATILGQAANAVLNVIYLTRMTKSIKLTRGIWKQSIGVLWSITKLGISSFVNQLALVVAIAVRNNVLVKYGSQSKYGPDIPVTTLGITMKTFSIIMCIVLGLCTGAQPILGFNYGAKRFDRVKKTFRLTVIISTVISIIGFLLAQLIPQQIIGIFGEESDLYNEFGVKCMKTYLMLVPLFGINIASGVFFQAIGYPVQSSVLSLSKQIIFQIPVTLILPLFLGLDGVLYTGPVSDLLTFILTIALILIYWKKIFNRNQPAIQTVEKSDR